MFCPVTSQECRRLDLIDGVNRLFPSAAAIDVETAVSLCSKAQESDPFFEIFEDAIDECGFAFASLASIIMNAEGLDAA